jgi:hypothetical protein
MVTRKGRDDAMGKSKIAMRLATIKSMSERGLIAKEAGNVPVPITTPAVVPTKTHKPDGRRKRMQPSEFQMEEVGIQTNVARKGPKPRYPFDKLVFVRNDDGTVTRNSFVIKNKTASSFAGTFIKARKRMEDGGLIPMGAALVCSQEGENLRVGFADVSPPLPEPEGDAGESEGGEE